MRIRGSSQMTQIISQVDNTRLIQSNKTGPDGGPRHYTCISVGRCCGSCTDLAGRRATTSPPDPRARRASPYGDTRPLGTRRACTSAPPGPGPCAFRSARIAGACRPPSVTVAAAAVPPGPWDLGAWSRGRDRAGAPTARLSAVAVVLSATPVTA
jgi:hypothetical protein